MAVCSKGGRMSNYTSKHKHPLYSTWRNMKTRCYNNKANNYHNYGGRGIKVCDRWLGKDGFWNFIYDMEDKPENNYSLDRIDNDKNYTPENCRWTDKSTQLNNKRINIIITLNNESKTLKEWSNYLGIKYETLRARFIAGLPPEKILLKEIRRHSQEMRNIYYVKSRKKYQVIVKRNNKTKFAYVDTLEDAFIKRKEFKNELLYIKGNQPEAF